ncbi:MAG: hypothetical protein ACRC2T_15640 [Thermoguttaceae bacterium]
MIILLLLPLLFAVTSWDNVCIGADRIISFYVSQTGDDTNIGSAAKPFKTIGRAQEAIRNSRKEGNGKRYVFLRAGTYEIAEPLKFGPLDGGTDKFSVTYSASTGEKVTVSTGRKISGWAPLEINSGSVKTGVVVADVPYLVQPVEAKPAEEGVPEQEAVPGVKWDFSELVVNKMPAKHLAFTEPPNASSDVFSEPGSWCLDVENQKIYYRLRKKETAESIEAVVPRARQIAIIQGDKDNEEPVKNLFFKNLHFFMPGTVPFVLPAIEIEYADNCITQNITFDIIPDGNIGTQ